MEPKASPEVQTTNSAIDLTGDTGVPEQHWDNPDETALAPANDEEEKDGF